MQDDGARRCAASTVERVVVGGARVDDDGLAGLARERELLLEERALRVARRVVAEVVEPRLADRDGLRVLEQRAQLVDVDARRLAGLVRVDPERRRTRPRARSAIASAARAPRRSSRPRPRASTPAARARSSTSAASSLEVRVRVDHSVDGVGHAASSSSTTESSSLRKSGLGSRSGWPGGSSLGCPAPDPARVVAGQHLVRLRRPPRSTSRNSSGPASYALVAEQLVHAPARCAAGTA